MILCVGEIIVDGINDEKENEIIEKVGSAPFNVACAIKRLGGTVGFCGSVGDDAEGSFLLDFANAQNFNYLKIERLKQKQTTKAIVNVSV